MWHWLNHQVVGSEETGRRKIKAYTFQIKIFDSFIIACDNLEGKQIAY